MHDIVLRENQTKLSKNCHPYNTRTRISAGYISYEKGYLSDGTSKFNIRYQPCKIWMIQQATAALLQYQYYTAVVVSSRWFGTIRPRQANCISYLAYLSWSLEPTYLWAYQVSVFVYRCCCHSRHSPLWPLGGGSFHNDIRTPAAGATPASSVSSTW